MVVSQRARMPGFGHDREELVAGRKGGLFLSNRRLIRKGRVQGDKLTHFGSEGCAGNMGSERRGSRW